MMAAARRLIRAAEKFSLQFLSPEVAEGEELETNILSQNFARLRGGSTESNVIAVSTGKSTAERGFR
jgi:hypothetical protein